MTENYRLFRSYCFTVIIILCVLLAAVGLFTAGEKTEATVFRAAYSSVRVYSSEDNIIMNFGGNVLQLSPEALSDTLEGIRHTVLAPVNNLLDLIDVLAEKGR